MTPIAFRFLEPMTLPTPPAEWERSHMTLDPRTRFSPHWPMAATWASEPMMFMMSEVAR